MERIVDVGGVALPGDTVPLPQSDEVALGPGVVHTVDEDNNVQLQATRAGFLVQKGSTTWIESCHKREIAAEGDLVLGVVQGNPGEVYTVDIGATQPAALPILEFENATKRNRPHLKVGDLVYAKITLSHKHMEPELSCIHTNAATSGLGPLEGGFLFECSLSLVRRLLAPNCAVLNALGQTMRFEVVVGRNCRVWVKTKQASETVVIVNAIKRSELLTDKQIRVMVKKMVSRFQQIMQ
eukprot:m.99971 g.99971  ORF g.99971 m.99971 type:complete len:239 (-) comp13154_c3_seq1:456-1172(-)